MDTMATAASGKHDMKISTVAMDNISTIDISDYEILRGKDPHFLDTVSAFITEVTRLPEAQKKGSQCIKGQAAASRRLARKAIRDRCIDLPNGESISLGDPQIKAIIDQGSKMFHSGKSDPAQWNLAHGTINCAMHRTEHTS
jgi:hypothetical protein